MEMKSLSEMVALYEKRASEKEVFFGSYFKEKDVEGKYKMLKKMLETLGDVSMPEDHIKMFLYRCKGAGSYNSYDYLPEDVIQGYYAMIKDYEDMPLVVVNNLWNSYDKYCFRDYDMITPMHKIIEEFGMTDKATRAYAEYTWMKKKELGATYQEESKKLEDLKEEYGDRFICDLQRIITSSYYRADYVRSLIPSKKFMDASSVKTTHGYDIVSGEDVVTRILRGYVKLDDFSEDEHICLGPCTAGGYVFTSFTKKEYLEEIGQEPKKTR